MTLYTARVFKSRIDQPTVKWANSYEFSSGEAPFSYEDMQTHANNLVSFEETFHLSSVRFDRVVFSTYQPDSEPYNPDNLSVFARDDVGDVLPTLQEQEALDTVLWVRRVANTGRLGRAFYRGCLLDADIDTSAGQPSLTTAGELRLAAVWVVATAFLSDTLSYMVMAGQSLDSVQYLPAASGQKQVVQRVYNTSIHVRNVTDLAIAGVKRVQLSNKYFDKV